MVTTTRQIYGPYIIFNNYSDLKPLNHSLTSNATSVSYDVHVFNSNTAGITSGAGIAYP